MVYWPLTSAIIGIGIIAGFLSMITICSVLRIVSTIEEENEEDYYEEDSGLMGEPDDDISPDSTSI